jgi:NADH-quinone oxidoreductase subunit M
MGSLGLPGVAGFVGEFLVMQGAFRVNGWLAFVASFVIIFAAIYLLWMYQRVFFGPLENPENAKLQDLDRREIGYLLPLVVLCFWIGLYPKPFFDVLERPVNYVVARVDKDYAEQLRAAGTLPTLEAELRGAKSAAAGGAAAGGGD